VLPSSILGRLGLFGAAASLCVAGVAAHAADRITLRNGFTYDCARTEPVDGAHTRLFLEGTGDMSYVDVATAEIAEKDVLPPPPPQPKITAAFSSPRQDVPALLHQAGTQHNIDAELLASIVKAESSGNAHAVSRTGARGLMQLMPGTAREMGVADAFQPDQNIRGGASYFDSLLTRYRDNLALALAAYNAGPAAVDRFHGIPPYRETQAYVARVMTEFKRRKLALERTLQASR
jgi:hypothetical protein